MTSLPVSDLADRLEEVLVRVANGERVSLTRAGVAVAELSSVAAKPLSVSELLERWRGLPAVDPDLLRADIDAALEARL